MASATISVATPAARLFAKILYGQSSGCPEARRDRGPVEDLRREITSNSYVGSAACESVFMSQYDPASSVYHSYGELDSTVFQFLTNFNSL